MRVFFISEEMRFDTTPAEKFGEVVHLFTAAPCVLNPQRLLFEIIEELEWYKFNPDSDFVAMTGPTVPLVSLFMAVIKKYGRVRALIFDARNDSYKERVMKL